MKIKVIGIAAMLLVECGSVFASIPRNIHSLPVVLSENNNLDTESMKKLEIEVSTPGKLYEQIYMNLFTCEELKVSGEINEDDFYTMWIATLYGNLSKIDLSSTILENNMIPDHAFFRMQNQINAKEGIFKSIKLKTILLPESLETIGQNAFAFAHDLCSVNFPQSLKRIEEFAFIDTSVTGILDLPNIEYMGHECFAGAKLSEIYISDNCILDGSYQFTENKNLKKANLPSCIEEIPDGIFFGCQHLGSLNLPESVKRIGKYAFGDIPALKEIKLPESIECIDDNAFISNTIESWILPKSLKYLGNNSIDLSSRVKYVICKATEAPECAVNFMNENSTPFGIINDNDRNDLTLYVPVGSLESYRNANGWNYFSEIIETEDFSQASIMKIINQTMQYNPNPIYDLEGKKISSPEHGNIYITDGNKILF